MRPPDPYADAPRLAGTGPLDPATLFPGSGPLELEIGPGRGGFLFERAAERPEVRLVGLEIRRKWATLVDRRLAGQGLGARARVFAEDVRDGISRFPDGSFEAVFVHFPDPWWKARHAKRRVLDARLVEAVERVLVPGGLFYVQTDVEDRALAVEALVAGAPRLVGVGRGRDGGTGAWLDESPVAARSPRERRAIADGLPVHRLAWRRR